MNWQPIKTAPKDGTIILVCASAVISGAFWRDGKWINPWDHSEYGQPPSQWMPMPDLPEGV